METIHQARRFKPLALFLIARMIYIDALATIFAMGGVYAAGTFHMTEREVLFFGIVLNITAGLGALFFSVVDDKIGPRATILISLGGLLAGGLVILIVHAEVFFWIGGAFLGIFVGPVQAASRSYMARAAPENMRNQMFGLYAFSGKATAFAGPLMVGWLTYATGSQRIGMTTIIFLLTIGGILNDQGAAGFPDTILEPYRSLMANPKASKRFAALKNTNTGLRVLRGKTVKEILDAG